MIKFDTIYLATLVINPAKRLLRILALLMMLLLSGAGVMATNYYTFANGSPNVLANWWTGTNGTGTHPASFTNTGDVFIIQNNNTMTATGNWFVSNLTINTGATFNTSTFSPLLRGDFTINGTFTANNSWIFFEGNVNQSIDGFTTGGHVVMAKSGGTATFHGNVNGGVLEINGTGGTLNLGAGLIHTFTGSWNNTNGTLNGGSSLLRIEGNVVNSGGVFTAGTGTVEWNGWDDQTVAGVTYNNLIISGSGTKTLAGNTNVGGILTVKAGTTLALGSYTLGASTAPTSVVVECGASAGSVIYGSTGTLYLGGNVTVNNAGTGNNGATISCPVALGAPRMFNVANDGTSATDLTVSGVISGASFPLAKVGEGKLVLTANNTFSGGLNISAGTTELGAADVIATQMITSNGGTFSTGATAGYNETVGIFALTNNSTIHLGTGNHSLHFAASTGVSWTSGKILSITGWAGTPGSSGTAGKIYFGASTGTLTAAQLSQISFVGYPGTPILLSTGELVPYVVTPVITVGSISDFGNQCINTASDIQSYTVSGSSLTNTVVIAPPSGFEISVQGGSSFNAAPYINLHPAPDGSIPDQTIYVRFKPTAAQAYSGNITHTSTGATAVNVAVSGYGKDRPLTATNPNPADGLPGVPYEGSGALSSVSWSAVSGATSYDVYFGAGILPGSPTATSVVANSYSIGALSGSTTYHWKVVPKNDCGATTGTPVEWTFTTGSSPIVTVSAASLGFGTVCVNSSSSDQSYTISGTSLTEPIEITPPSGFEISLAGGESFESESTLIINSSDGTGTISNFPIYVRFVPTAAQVYSGNITHTSTGATTVNVAVTGEGNPSTVAGSVSGGTTICSGSTSGLLILGAHTGTIVRWESTVSPFENWTPIVNTADTYISGALTATTQFRAVVQSGECDAANSLATTITVEATPVAGTLAKDPNLNIVCEGTSVNTILTPGSGGNSTDQLEYQTTGSTVSDWTEYISGSAISTTGKSRVEVRTRRMADYCTPSGYNTVSWTVEATPVTGSLAKTPDVETVCEGTGVSARIVGGSGGGTYFREFLQYRIQIGSTWSVWATYIPDEVIFTTGMSGVEMRAKRGGSVCPNYDWVYASWTVVAQPVAGAIIKTPDLETICEGTAVLATFSEGSGGVSCTDTYEYRYDGIGEWTEYTPATTLSTTGHTLVEIRTQRDGCQDHCNTDTRAVNWTVGDDQVPTISCPTAQIVNVDPGSCQYMVKGTEFDPTYSDNCGVTEARNSVTGGAFSLKDALFNVGEHTVTWTVKDAAGNSATCSFSLTVVDNQNPTLIPTILPPTTSFTSGGWTSDFTGINVNNTGNTYALVAPGAPVNLKFNWNMYYTGSYCPSCITQHYVTLQASGFNACNQSWSGGNGNKNYTFNAPTTPGVYYISLASSWWYSCNQFYTMYGPNTADAALGYILVGTNTSCALNIVKNTDPGECRATITKGIDVVPLDNCGIQSLTYTLEGATEGAGTGSLSTYTFNKGVTTISYLTTDNSNNSYNCSFTVTVNDSQAPVVPVNGSKTVECVADAITPEIPVATDLCDGTVNGVLVSVTDNLNPLTCQGTMIYRYSYTDASANVSYWTFTYNIIRITPPAEEGTPVATSGSVECIAGAVSPILPQVKDVCGETLDAPQPVLIDNYDPVTCGGTREYKYTYTDCAGFEFIWVFTYTIKDETPPVIACKTTSIMLDLDGNASIVAADVDNGSADNCAGALSLELNRTSFTCADWPLTTVTLKGTDCAGNSATCNATVNVDLRPTELVYSGDLFIQYSDQVKLEATLKDVTTNAPIAGKTITFQIGSQSATAVTNASGVATAPLIITQAPGSYSVIASYAEECPFAAGTETHEFRIGVERACADYSGVLMASTGSVNSTVANVLLAFTITQESDGFPGDIRNAVVQFYQYSSTSIDPIGPMIPVGLVDPNDMSFGTAVYEWKYDLGTLPSNTVSVFAVVSGGYFRNNRSCFGLTPVTIYKPGTEFIAGGGYLMLEKPSGTIQADIPSKNNFGFNVKYNKKGTSLQGNINTIVRKTILNTANGEYELHEYQVKGNALSSLTVGTTVDGVTPAVFSGKANLQDVTDLQNPVSLDGNFVMKVTMTDKGEPGSSDMISITVFDKSGGIWFTSRWENNKTVEQVLAGGNLVVQGTNKKSAEIYTEIPITPEIEYADLKVYPNPFSEKLNFEFVSPVDDHVRIQIFDVTGRMINTVFDNPVKAGIIYNTEFKPASLVTSMYFYRMTLGEKVFVGKVVYKK